MHLNQEGSRTRTAELRLRHAVETSVSRALRLFADSHQTARSTADIVLGVSGGEDSTVLFHLLLRLRQKLNVRLVVCHIDHGLRAESVQDAKFVQDLCNAAGVFCACLRAGTRSRSENVEAWGRRIRYAHFEEVRKQCSAQLILTAHHQNDQAETLLFRLLTGRLLTSARSISELDRGNAILRPLLRVSKRDIREYSVHHQLQFVTDGTNTDCVRTRNRIRLELLPTLEDRYNPNSVEDLSLIAARLGEDDEWLAAEARRVSANLPLPLPLSAIRQLPPALRWRVLATKAEERFGIDAGKIGFHAFHSVLGIIELEALNGPKTVELGFGFLATVHPGIGVEFRNSDEEIAKRAASIIDTR